MPQQPFFVPYSPQVCPVDVQTVEEPSEKSQISLFLCLFCLFIALVLFVNYRRANHRQRPIIIGFSVLLSINGAVASDASATTEEPGWFMKIINYFYEHPLIIILMGVIAFIVVNWALYACIQFCMEHLRRTNNNNVAPYVNAGYAVGTDQVQFNVGHPHREMPHQPFFVPYSSQVCPADVQTVEEPSEESQISLFLYLFVALVLFVNYIRANHRQRPIIIGCICLSVFFQVLLFVGGVFASAVTTTSTISTISTTYEAVEEWVWSFWRDYVLIVNLALIVGMAVLGLVTYTCFVYWQRRRDNRNVVRPQYIIGFLVLLSVNGAVASDASATTEEPGWLATYYRENEKVINPVIIGLACFAFIAFICRIFHLCCFKRPNTNNNNVSPYVNAAFVVGTDQVQFNVGHPHQVYQNPNQH